MEVYLASFSSSLNVEPYIHIVKKFVNIDINYKSVQTVIGWFVLIQLLLKKMDKNDIIFSKNIYGKPYLIGNKFYFNISHSKQKVAVALYSEEVGVDIEKIANPNLKIVDRFFTYDEKNFVFLCDNKLKIAERFYIIWTLKESYLKYKGVGFKQSLKSFSFNVLKTGEFILYLDRDCVFKVKKIDGYIVSCCSKKVIGNNVNFKEISYFFN